MAKEDYKNRLSGLANKMKTETPDVPTQMVVPIKNTIIESVFTIGRCSTVKQYFILKIFFDLWQVPLKLANVFLHSSAKISAKVH